MVISDPASVRLRAYQVGFGDCLLLTIGYAEPLSDGRTEGHLLIDFGAKVLAKGGPRFADLAAQIAQHSGGRLDGVVVTHRHQDHVQGFADVKARAHIESLDPGVIIRSWTDMPEPVRARRSSRLGRQSREFLGLLDVVGNNNAQVTTEFGLDSAVLAKRVAELAELGVSNVQALAMLDAWVPPPRTTWVRAGDLVDVPSLPGVSIEVLGPPTLEQVPNLQSYASSSNEYWLGLAGAARIEPELAAVAPDDVAHAKETVASPGGLGRAAWLVDKLKQSRSQQVLDIVAGFDDVLNNTSVVLLVRVGLRTLLFAGDAQVENWSYTLDRARGENGQAQDRQLHDRLASVDLYKVGHHGSRNATPKRLVDLWRTERRPGHQLCSVLSTRSGIYGSTAEGKVPKRELVDALARLGTLHTTEKLPPGVWWFDVKADATTEESKFVFSPAAPQR